MGNKSYYTNLKALKKNNIDHPYKVELGIIQDGESDKKEVLDNIKEAQASISNLFDFQKRAENIFKEIEMVRKEVEGQLKKFDNASTALGEEKRDLFTHSQNLKNSVKELEGITKNLDTVAKEMGLDVPGLTEMKKIAAQGTAFDKTIEKAYNNAKLPMRPSQSF